MMMGSASSSLLNLIAMTIAVSRVDLRELDFYFVYRDAAESVLKILFISQIGSVFIAALKVSKKPQLITRNIFVYGCGFVALILTCWLFIFPLFSSAFLNTKPLHTINVLDSVELAILVFCLFTWLDTIATALLIQVRLFLLNHILNILSAALLCILIILPGELSVASMASAYAVSKIAGTIPKIFICTFCKSEVIRQVSLMADPISSEEPKIEVFGILKMVSVYTPSNFLLMINKFFYLAGVAFLSPGYFAIYNIYYRYYTALQNLITVNIFNLSASRLVNLDLDQSETMGLLYRHTLSFLTLYSGVSILMLLFSVPVVSFYLPEFLTTQYVTVLWSVILLNFLPDGINFIFSRRSILQNDLKFDSRLNSLQAFANLVLLYPAMRFFEIIGLVYATLLICLFFAAIRLYHLSLTVTGVNKAFRRVAMCNVALLITSLTSLVFPAWLFCLVAFSVSVVLLGHLLYLLRGDKDNYFHGAY